MMNHGGVSWKVLFSCSGILALFSGAGHSYSHIPTHYDDLKGMKVLLIFRLPLLSWPYQIASWLPTILQWSEEGASLRFDLALSVMEGRWAMSNHRDCVYP